MPINQPWTCFCRRVRQRVGVLNRLIKLLLHSVCVYLSVQVSSLTAPSKCLTGTDSCRLWSRHIKVFGWAACWDIFTVVVNIFYYISFLKIIIIQTDPVKHLLRYKSACFLLYLQVCFLETHNTVKCPFKWKKTLETVQLCLHLKTLKRL